MKLAYISVPVITMERHAVIVKDEDDLKRLMEKRQQSVVVPSCKPERDKTGAIITFQLSKDWDPR